MGWWDTWQDITSDTDHGPEPDAKPTPKPKPVKTKPKPKPKPVAAPPTKTSRVIADQSEAERLRARFSTRGWPGTILTSGLGDLSVMQVGGVTLGS